MTGPRPLCVHCALPVVGRHASPDPRPLCGTGPLVPPGRVDCAGLVVDWGHPTPCVDCEGYAGPEDGFGASVWLAALCGVSAERVMEAATW
jgi:hypothetical protein